MVFGFLVILCVVMCSCHSTKHKTTYGQHIVISEWYLSYITNKPCALGFEHLAFQLHRRTYMRARVQVFQPCCQLFSFVTISLFVLLFGAPVCSTTSLHVHAYMRTHTPFIQDIDTPIHYSIYYVFVFSCVLVVLFISCVFRGTSCTETSGSCVRVSHCIFVFLLFWQTNNIVDILFWNKCLFLKLKCSFYLYFPQDLEHRVQRLREVAKVLLALGWLPRPFRPFSVLTVLIVLTVSRFTVLENPVWPIVSRFVFYRFGKSVSRFAVSPLRSFYCVSRSPPCRFSHDAVSPIPFSVLSF